MNVELTLSANDLDRLAELVAEKLAGTIATSTSTNGSTKDFWSEEDAAAKLGVSKYSMQRWRRDGLIAAASDKRPIRYSRKNLDAAAEWLRTR